MLSLNEVREYSFKMVEALKSAQEGLSDSNYYLISTRDAYARTSLIANESQTMAECLSKVLKEVNWSIDDMNGAKNRRLSQGYTYISYEYYSTYASTLLDIINVIK